MILGRGLALCLAIVVSACNLQGPQVTLTVVPMETVEPQATDQEERSTATRMFFHTATATPSPAPTDTVEPTATQALEPTDGPTPTKLLPSTATEATAESEDSESPPTLTPLPTYDATDLAQLFASPRPRPSAIATWTAAPTSVPTTLLATRRASPLPATGAAQLGLETARPSLTPTRFQPTVAVRADLIVEAIPPPSFQPSRFDSLGASVYAYDIGPGQPFNYEGLRLTGGVVLFAPNPAAPESYLRTDQLGMLWYRPIGAVHEETMSHSPFHRGFSVSSSDENKNRVVEIDWSADGTQFSFRIDTPPGQDKANAGVWFWQSADDSPTDPTYALIHDCAADGDKSCNIVNPSSARLWKTTDVAWSPELGSSAILLSVALPEEGRNALAIVQASRDPSYAKNAPPFFRYDYGHWNVDGSGIVVSGRRADGEVIIAAVNRDLTGERVLFNASAAGMWLRDAVMLPDGRIVALGRRGGPHDNGPVALVDGAGRALSTAIGEASPEKVSWYPDRSVVVVTVQGRQYSVHVDSGVVSDTTDLTRAPIFGRGDIGVAPIPAAVIQGSAYYPGQQLRTALNLNLRQGPSTSSQIVAGLHAGDYVAILAGPYDSEGYRWWRAQTAFGQFGWVAGTIGGRSTLYP